MDIDPFPVRVLMFARARDLAGTDSANLSLPVRATIAELRAALAVRHPALAPLLARSIFAVNHVYADDSTPLFANDEIALIPPVSGG